MPSNQPKNLKHFVQRSAKSQAEMTRLQQGLLLVPGAAAKRLTLDEVADCVAASELVSSLT